MPASPGLSALACVIAAHAPDAVLTGESAAGEALQAAARLLAAEGRAQDPVRAERLLTALRAVWQRLPAVERLADHQRSALWDRLVQLCCEEFYAPSRPDAPTRAGAAGAVSPIRLITRRLPAPPSVS